MSTAFIFSSLNVCFSFGFVVSQARRLCWLSVCERGYEGIPVSLFVFTFTASLAARRFTHLLVVMGEDALRRMATPVGYTWNRVMLATERSELVGRGG